MKLPAGKQLNLNKVMQMKHPVVLGEFLDFLGPEQESRHGQIKPFGRRGHGNRSGFIFQTLGLMKFIAGFNPQKVAGFSAKKIAALLKNPGIVRNRLKVNAAVNNAKRFLEVQREFGSFSKYIWSFFGGKQKVNRWKKLSQLPAASKESDALSADLKKRGFKFIGSTIVYAHLQAAGLVNDHLVSCFRHKACSDKKRGFKSS